MAHPAYVETSYCTFNNGKWFYKDNSIKPCAFQNIGDALWWCFVTMATVGYGDFVPQTVGGKTIATLVMITSIIFLGLPTTIFSANLSELYAQFRIAEETKRRLKVRQKSLVSDNPKSKNPNRAMDLLLMVEDLEAEMSIIRANLDRLTETHRGIILHIKSNNE